MSINRSTLEFQTIDPEANEWLRVIRHFELDPADIIIEITNLLDGDQRSAQVRIDARARRTATWPSTTSAPAVGTELSAYLPGGSGEDRPSPFVRHPLQRAGPLLLDGIINIVHNLGMQVVIGGETRAAQLPLPEGAFTRGYLLSRPLASTIRPITLDSQPSGNEPANLTTGAPTLCYHAGCAVMSPCYAPYSGFQ